MINKLFDQTKPYSRIISITFGIVVILFGLIIAFAGVGGYLVFSTIPFIIGIFYIRMGIQGDVDKRAFIIAIVVLLLLIICLIFPICLFILLAATGNATLN